MKDLILDGYEFLSVIIPLLITFGIMSLVYRKKAIQKLPGHFVKVLIFAVYIFGVYYFTNTGTLFNILQHGIELRADQLNLLPFSQGINIIVYLLNVVLFMPLGFMMPLIWPNFNKVIPILVSGISFSLLIEASQLLNNRSTDIDDLLLNTLGALIGYLIFRLSARMTKRIDQPVVYYRYEVVIYILAMFVGRFLAFNEFGMARILYGF